MTNDLPQLKNASLPADPDGQNNERALWADHALRAFMAETGTDYEDALCDLLCDLMHLSDRTPFDFEAALTACARSLLSGNRATGAADSATDTLTHLQILTSTHPYNQPPVSP